MGKTPQQTVYKVCSQSNGISYSAWVPRKLSSENKKEPIYMYSLRYDLYKITRPLKKGHLLFAFSDLAEAIYWSKTTVNNPIIYKAVGYNPKPAPLEIPNILVSYPEHIKVFWKKMPRTYDEVRAIMTDCRMQGSLSCTILCTAIKLIKEVW